jgi:hypothetical protein
MNTVDMLRGMIKRLIAGGIVGGITLFMWGFVSWVILTWHFDTLRHDSGVTAVVEDIEDHLPETGVYYFPPMPTMRPDKAEMEAYMELHESGPSGMIFYTAEHLDPMPPRRLLLGFIVDIGAATFATLLLIVALPSLPKYWGRVVFVAALGVFAIFAVRMVDGVFHNLPIRWTVNLTLDTAISWVLTGLVLAAIVRPSKDSA